MSRLILKSRHRLKCGDSTNEDDVADLMQGEKADMVFTDPPYGVSYQSNVRIASEKFAVLKNDNVFLDFKNLLLKNLRENSPIFIWTSHHVFSKWFSMYESIYKSTVIWYKACGGMGDLQGDYATDFEMALYCVKGKPKFINGRPMAVWQIKKDSNSSYIHPTQKPTALAENAMSHFLQKNKTVLDLFLGSGSTLIACEKTNRKCYGMELDEHYCSVIIKRWEEFTGEKAVLEKNDDFSES